MSDKRREAPGESARDPAADRVRDRRTQTFTTLAPLLGIFLLMPPFIQVFVGAGTMFGVPAIVVYIFGVWAALIAAAGLIARRLSRPRADNGRR